MEKKRRSLYTMFIKWTWSYVLLATVAIIVISFCAMKYNQVLRDDLEYTNSVQLELVQLQMDQNVRRLRLFANKANLNSKVTNLRHLDSYENVSRYELYELVRELADEMLLENGTHDCYLYFPAMDFLISGNYYNDSREYYDIAFESYGFSYEDWYEIIHKDYRTAQIFSLDTKQGEPLTVLIKPLDSSSRQTPAVNAIMIMDMNEILKSSKWLNQDRDQMCIIDRVNKRIVANSVLEEEVRAELLEQVNGSYLEPSGRLEIDSSITSAISSQYEKWNYVVITQEQPALVQITELQRLVMMLIIGYLLISAVAIGYAVIRQYLPMKKVMEILQQEDDSSIRMDENAYEYISKSVHNLVNKNRENTSVISRQKYAISRELFHRLLKEKQAYAMIDEELLRQYGICVEDCRFCLLAYRIEQFPESYGEELLADTQEMSWFILQNVTEENLVQAGMEILCFREGRQEQIFLIWSNTEREELKETVEGLLKESSEFIRLHFKFSYQMALSELHKGTEEIYQAYREISRVFEYQKKEEGRDVIHYGQINLLPTDTLLKYPIDVENRLAHSVSTGNAEDACSEIRQLLKDNQVSSLAPEVTQFLVSNIAASIFRVAGKVLKDDTSLHISQKELMETCRQGDPQRMQEELERLVTVICHEMAEENKKEKENQRGKLYLDAKSYVEEHYSDAELSVNAMAEAFGVQSTYLSKIFKEKEGAKLSQYIHKVRLVHVKEMLKEGAKLEDIAIQCGFGSQRTFLRIFKQYEGVTPTQYKELEEKKGKEGQDL